MNKTGIEQVELAARAIKAEDWDVILTSPLTRAKQSAEIIARRNGFSKIIEQDLLIERSFGEAEGLSHQQWRAKYSNLDEIPGGESRTQVVERSFLLLETISKELAGKRVLAISHGALIRSLISIASNDELPRDGERLGNASLNVVKHTENSWQVVNYSLGPLVP